MKMIPILLVVLALAPQLHAEDAPPRDLAKKLEETRVTFQFIATPVRAALKFLSESSGVPIRLARNADGDSPVTFRAKDMTLRRALHWITFQSQLDYITSQDAVLVDERDRIITQAARLRTFDVRDLMITAPDYPAPGLLSHDFQPFDAPVYGDVTRNRWDEDELVDLVRQLIDRRSWDVEGISMELRRGVLFVTNAPATLDKIGEFLGELRSHVTSQISVEARLLSMSAAAWQKWLGGGESGDGKLLLTPEQTAAARAQRADDDEVRVLELLGTTGAARQRVHASSSQAHAAIRDLDVEVATGVAVADPIVDTVAEGMELDVRPIPSADGKDVSLRLAIEVVRPRAGSRLTYGGAGGTGAVELELPESAFAQIHTTVRIPFGGSVAFSLTDLDDNKDTGRRMVVLVTAQQESEKN